MIKTKCMSKYDIIGKIMKNGILEGGGNMDVQSFIDGRGDFREEKGDC